MTTSCSLPDLKLLKVFSCSPSKMGLSVAPPCKARLTECTTPYVTSAEKMAGVDDELFELKICKTLQAKGCLDQNNNGAVCTAGEIAAIADEVVCDGTSGLLSSVLLLAAMLVLTRVM
ncbi:hypothetical protein EGW08_020340 [Elysia chlorotica]|uniref:Uncharacterized protein n=1 Tax=Elysia chlorotica TaxID=188477 RepID=A0A433SRK1_ELYCH|nr:hypothetical protein EGW08_020340 [Elysia chlorotica]